jgi:uncharacterized protein
MELQLPHENAFTRLGRSEIDGIGVFAIRDIPLGTNIFPNDRLGIKWINKAIIDTISDDTIRKLYAEFAIRKGELLGCPANFNSMTVGWYLNEPVRGDKPNVVVDGNYAFFAARDIAAGEELTARYADFSDN